MRFLRSFALALIALLAAPFALAVGTAIGHRYTHRMIIRRPAPMVRLAPLPAGAR